MDYRKPDKPTGVLRLSNLVQRFGRKASGTSQDEPQPNDELSARNRAHNLFRSIKKKFRQSKASRSKQKIADQQQQQQHSCQEGYEITNGHVVTDGLSHLETVEMRCHHQSTNSPSKSHNNNPPPVPPRHTYLSKSASYEDIDEPEMQSQYLDMSELNQDSILSRMQHTNDDRSTIQQSKLANEVFNLAKHGWFWGPLTRKEAERKLCNQPDGSFLVRDSSSDRYIFTLSFRSYGKTLHTHIPYDSNGTFSMGDDLRRETVAQLVDEAIRISKDAIFSYSTSRSVVQPQFPVRLTRPVSRLTEVRTLKYLCRFVIRQTINVNNIDKLPLPNSVKGYLHQGQY